MSNAERRSTVILPVRLNEYNQVLGAVERIIRSLGRRTDSLGAFEDEVWCIAAGKGGGGSFGVTIAQHGRERFRAWWKEQGDSGRVLLDEPGEWKAALLAIPTHHA